MIELVNVAFIVVYRDLTDVLALLNVTKNHMKLKQCTMYRDPGVVL